MTVPLDPTGKPATIYDVARHAGVSHQTVALYLRGHQGFRPATRERVEEALKQLNYRPNLAARALATAKSHRIGALVYALEEAGPNRTIQGASERAREWGYVLDLVTLDPRDPSGLENALASLGQQSLAGLLAFAPIDLIEAEIARIPFSVPFVAEGHVPSTLSSTGLPLLIDHLVSLGHTGFFHLAGPSSWSATREREKAFSEALATHGLTSLGSIPGDWTAAAGYTAAHTLDLNAGITALVAADDQIALGALLALSERGVSVPADISVTGFDDLPEAAYYQPPLTTVRVDYHQQGRVLVDRLLNIIDADASPGELHNTEPTLVVRRSTAAARAKS